MYDTTAFLYDAIAAFENPESVCDDLIRVFAGCGIQPPGLLGDLGAGTGLMSALLAERGWHVYGVERSMAMLGEAMKRRESLADEAQTRLMFAQGDITSFELPPGFQLDGAVCLCNTVNHLAAPGQLESFFGAAFRALKPSGVLVFDSDTLKTFQDFFHHEPTVVWDDGVHRMTRACRFDDDTGLASHRAILEQYMDGVPQPVSEEAMTLRYHPETDIQKRLDAAGLELLSVQPFNPFPSLYTGGFIPKALWIVRKPEP